MKRSIKDHVVMSRVRFVCKEEADRLISEGKCVFYERSLVGGRRYTFLKRVSATVAGKQKKEKSYGRV